ncbi:MAG: RNA polymerase sigma factor [Bacillota bacterium]|nr:RNA polymerase sigma factor [Bacillota bacterium]
MANITEEIYNNYKKPIYNYFYRSVFNSHTAEELTQDTFLKAFKYFSNFRGESSVKPWLFKIAHNTYLNYLKKSSGMREENIEDFDTADRSDIFSNSNEKMIIRKVLKKLNDDERTLIILRDLNNLTYAEISSIMDYTEGQVKIGLHRARKRFRNLYNIENKEG